MYPEFLLERVVDYAHDIASLNDESNLQPAFLPATHPSAHQLVHHIVPQYTPQNFSQNAARNAHLQIQRDQSHLEGLHMSLYLSPDARNYRNQRIC